MVGFTAGLDIANHIVSDADADMQVTVTTLDSQLAGRNASLTMFKIDAEGHDLEVIRGGMASIRRLRPIIMLEAWEGGQKARRLLARFEYRAYRYDAKNRTLEQIPDDFEGQANLLLISPGRYSVATERVKSSRRPKLCVPEVRWILSDAPARLYRSSA
jgi:hypothetical protein